MDILGQDRITPVIKKTWRNGAEADILANLKSQIDSVSAELSAQQTLYDTANANYIKCVQERSEKLFGLYSCKNNTGDTQISWKTKASVAKSKIATLKDKLALLQADYKKAIEIANAAAAAGKQVSEKEIMENLSSQEEAKTYGIWIALGLVVVAGGFVVYKKFIKK